MNPELIGFLAGVLVAAALLPQVIKSRKTKSTKDISLGWSITSTAGQIMWLVYGVLVRSLSLTIMSGITLILSATILYMKLRYGRR